MCSTRQAVRKLYEHLKAAKEAAVGRSLPVAAAAPALTPHPMSLDEELDEAAQVCKIIVLYIVVLVDERGVQMSRVRGGKCPHTLCI